LEAYALKAGFIVGTPSGYSAENETMVKGLTLLNDLPFWVIANGRQTSGLLGTLVLWLMAGASVAMVVYLIRCYFQEARRIRRIQRRLRTNGDKETVLNGRQTDKPAMNSGVEVLAATERRVA
jgi:hypothetical protein